MDTPLKIYLQDSAFAHCTFSNNPMPPKQFTDKVEWIRDKTFTQDDIVELINIIWDERQNSHSVSGFVNNSSDKRTQQQIDIQMVMQILSNMGYAKRDTEEELRTYFHLFDGGDKGYITVDDLQRVQNEVANGVEAQLSGDDTNFGGVINVVGSDMLQAMIDQFDSGNKGCISYDEFKMILQPELS